MTAENAPGQTRFSRKKTILFSCVAILLVWLCVEAILHTSTYFGILPYIPTLTPSLYTGETVKYKMDKYGCPIFVDGYKVYQQWGIPAQPVLFNSNGYRPADAKRFGSSDHKIGFFGDSYVEGLQVHDSETFPRLIEAHLKQEGKNVACFNFGVGGTGTYHHYLRYLTVSEQTHLDDVVLCFLPQNDVLNNHERLGKPFGLPNAPYAAIQDGVFTAPDGWGDDLTQKRAEMDTTQINRRVGLLRATIGTSFVATGIYRFVKLLAIDGRKRKADVWKMRSSWLGVYGDPFNEDWRGAWELTEAVLLRFAKAVKAKNGRLTLLIVADSLQITDAALLNPAIAAAADFEYPNKRLRKFCQQHGIVCLDSLPSFLDKKRTLEYPYFSWEYDGHYSKIGHQTMADFLTSTGRFDDIK